MVSIRYLHLHEGDLKKKIDLSVDAYRENKGDVGRQRNAYLEV